MADNLTTNGHFPETCPMCSRAVTPPETPVVAREGIRAAAEAVGEYLQAPPSMWDTIERLITQRLGNPVVAATRATEELLRENFLLSDVTAEEFVRDEVYQTALGELCDPDLLSSEPDWNAIAMRIADKVEKSLRQQPASRQSEYCYPEFDGDFNRSWHTWKDGRCTTCGIPAEPRQEGETPVVARVAEKIIDLWLEPDSLSGEVDVSREADAPQIAAIITRYLVGTPDPCAAAGRHVCGPMDQPTAPVMATDDVEGEK